jgi:hypothetical protein
VINNLPKEKPKYALIAPFSKQQSLITLKRFNFQSLFKLTKFRQQIQFHFLVFTKFFSHFVVLRGPFRDKISKNLLAQQRFYVYLSIIIADKRLLYFASKFNLSGYFRNFTKLGAFSSNILFLHSQKLSFSFHTSPQIWL